MTAKTHLIENELKGEWLEAAPGEHFLIRIPGSETNNSYSVTEFLSSPGSSTPIHLHEKEDEYLLVVEGMVRVLYVSSKLRKVVEAIGHTGCQPYLLFAFLPERPLPL